MDDEQLVVEAIGVEFVCPIVVCCWCVSAAGGWCGGTGVVLVVVAVEGTLSI